MGDDEIHYVVVSQAWMGIAGHHVAGLGDDETGAEHGGEILGRQGGIDHAHDVELCGADAGALGTIDLVEIRSQAREKYVAGEEREALALGSFVGGDEFTRVALDVGEAEIIAAHADKTLVAFEVNNVNGGLVRMSENLPVSNPVLQSG